MGLLSFIFSDPDRHGGRGDTMGRPSRSAKEADRDGWAAHDRSEGFTRHSRSGRRSKRRRGE